MEQADFSFWSTIIQAVTAAGLIYFAHKQTQINKRLQELQDFVAVSVIPLPSGGLNITNVGKTNLYLKKWEIGQIHEFFERSILLPAVNGINLTISTPSDPGEYPVKLYLYGESKKEKYIAEGKFFVYTAIIHGQAPLTEFNIEQKSGGTAVASPAPTIVKRS